MTDYRVVPEALRDMATEYQDAGDEWGRLVAVLDGAAAELRDDSLGLLGQVANFVSTYNDARTAMLKELRQAQQALSDAGDTLGDVARHYEDKDFEYYRKFGYIEERNLLKPEPKARPR